MKARSAVRARGEGGACACDWTHTWGREASAALPLAALRRTAAGGRASGEGGAHGCAWTRTWDEGAEQALSLAERAAPSACVCVLRGGGVGVGHTQHREGALCGVRGRGGMCAWVLGGECWGVHGLAVMQFCPEAQSLARRLTALMGPWPSGESDDSSGITFRPSMCCIMCMHRRHASAMHQ
jgi:hypothetical protein